MRPSLGSNCCLFIVATATTRRRTLSWLLALALLLSFVVPSSTHCDSRALSFIGSMVPLRRSARLRIQNSCSGSDVDVTAPSELEESSANSRPPVVAKRRRIASNRSERTKAELEIIERDQDSNDGANDQHCSIDPPDIGSDPIGCLGRPRERSLLTKDPELRFVMGIDEAGRGPLAGPVVAAAAIVPANLPGVADSKKITDENKREELYESIVTSPNVRWAVAIVDAPTIDEINILQATLLGMRMAARAVLSLDGTQEGLRREATPGTSIPGCYVVLGQTDGLGQPCSNSARDPVDSEQAYALVDGNRVPADMPCRAESIVKGDSKEYSIAAASILAKVTRDRLMHAYSSQYPEYSLSQHKGYPTAAHVSAVRRHGPCPIHRKTFAPIKHLIAAALVVEQAGSVVTASSDGLSTDDGSSRGTGGRRDRNRRGSTDGGEGRGRPARRKRHFAG